MLNKSYGRAVFIACFVICFCFFGNLNANAANWMQLSSAHGAGVSSKDSIGDAVGKLNTSTELCGLLFVEPSPDKQNKIFCSRSVEGNCKTGSEITSGKYFLRNAQGILLHFDIRSP